MALPELTQATTLLGKATAIGLIVPRKPSYDAFCSMLALYLVLIKKHPGTSEAISPAHVPAALQFLPGSSQVKTTLTIQPSITLDIAGPDTIIGTRQEKLQGGVRLHVLLQPDATVTKDQVETSVRLLPYDVIITFGASDLEELGDLFTSHADFFYNTPIINVDHRATNEHYGTVNIVDITFSSTAEVTHELITRLDEGGLDADSATALYAGIVAATESFQKPTTTPHAFALAARLMEEGADKELVIQHLVKTKPLALLKLAGRAYARLRHDEYGGLYWTILRPVDFRESGADPELIPDVMRELINNISGYNAAFMLHEGVAGNFQVYLTLGKGLAKRRQEIQMTLSARKENSALTFPVLAPTLEEAERDALTHIRSILP